MAESSVRQAFRDMLTARSADRVQSMGGVLTRFESTASPEQVRGPSTFQADLVLTTMCFTWIYRMQSSQLALPDHLIRRFGRILAA